MSTETKWTFTVSQDQRLNICKFKAILNLSQTTNFRPFQTEAFADDDFKLDENGRKVFERVENTEGKGEIACYEQFLLFPQCF